MNKYSVAHINFIERNVGRIMDVELIERIICPVCRNELQWHIKRKHNNKVIGGYAKCTECGEIYPINNGIAIFLPAKWQNMKIWERSERIVIQKKGTGEKQNVLIDNNLNP